MEQKTIDKLVERLGMTPALAPLLNSGNGYEKFEEALKDFLYGREQKGNSKYDSVKIGSKNVGIEDASQARSYFARYWGVGCEEQTVAQIAFSDFGIQKYPNYNLIEGMSAEDLKALVDAEGRGQKQHLVKRILHDTEKRREFFNEIKSRKGANILLKNGVYPSNMARVQKYLGWMEHFLKKNRKDLWYGAI